jgi:hypothetical protein
MGTCIVAHATEYEFDHHQTKWSVLNLREVQGRYRNWQCFLVEVM